MKIFFIRHCKTDKNLSNIWQGKNSDEYLSIEGQKELILLKDNLNFIPDIIFSSPLKRAIETAEGIKNKDTELIIEKCLIERDFGKLEGTETDENDKNLLSDYDLNTDLNQNVEKIQDMYLLRIKPFLLQLKKEFEHSNKNIVIVSHSWVGRLLSFFSTNENNKDTIKTSLKNGIIYEFDI